MGYTQSLSAKTWPYLHDYVMAVTPQCTIFVKGRCRWKVRAVFADTYFELHGDGYSCGKMTICGYLAHICRRMTWFHLESRSSEDTMKLGYIKNRCIMVMFLDGETRSMVHIRKYTLTQKIPCVKYLKGESRTPSYDFVRLCWLGFTSYTCYVMPVCIHCSH